MSSELVEVGQVDREAAANLKAKTPWSREQYLSGKRDRGEEVQAFARHRQSERKARIVALVQPWSDYHGDLPDYDHPLRCVFESGVQYAVELLAKTLKVEDWVPCDGTEEYDGDLGGTLMNIVLEAMPKDAHGDPVHPGELPSALAAEERVARLEEALEQAAADFDDHVQHAQARIDDGKELGSSVWRIALGDIVQEGTTNAIRARAALAQATPATERETNHDA